MKRLFLIGIGTIAVFLGPSCGVPMAQSDPDSRPAAAPARDGEIAVQEEFDAAERAGTAAAWRLFAARHPDHALARIALDRAQRLEADRVHAP